MSEWMSAVKKKFLDYNKYLKNLEKLCLQVINEMGGDLKYQDGSLGQKFRKLYNKQRIIVWL